MLRRARAATASVLARTCNTYNFAAIKDYEYANKIRQHLSGANINGALSLIIQSHLDNVILDRNVYNNYFAGCKLTKADISYYEIGYKMFREHFKPYPLIVDWMHYLAGTSEGKLKELLQGDFRQLNLDFPTGTTENKGQAQTRSPQQPPHRNTNNLTKPQPLNPTQQQLVSIINQRSLGSTPQQQQLIQTLITFEYARVDKLFQHLFGPNSKIIVNDIDITYDSGRQEHLNDLKEINQKYNEVNDNDGAGMEHTQDDDEEVGMMVEDDYMSRLKIGTIEIVSNKMADYSYREQSPQKNN